jgi:hypothetical protein
MFDKVSGFLAGQLLWRRPGPGQFGVMLVFHAFRTVDIAAEDFALLLDHAG